MAQLPALQSEPLTDTIHTLLREQIMKGVYRPGERLNVDGLAQQLNVSKTPVKSALTLMVADGLVVVHPRRGTYIAQVSADDLSEMFAIRLALELLAAETLLEHTTAEDVVLLGAMVRQIKTATDVETHYQGNSRFHQHLVGLSSNQKLVQFYRQLNSHIHIALIHSGSDRWRSRVVIEATEHGAIVDALTSRDAAVLRKAIVAHLERASVSLLDDLQTQASKEVKDPDSAVQT